MYLKQILVCWFYEIVNDARKVAYPIDQRGLVAATRYEKLSQNFPKNLAS